MQVTRQRRKASGVRLGFLGERTGRRFRIVAGGAFGFVGEPRIDAACAQRGDRGGAEGRRRDDLHAGL